MGSASFRALSWESRGLDEGEEVWCFDFDLVRGFEDGGDSFTLSRRVKKPMMVVGSCLDSRGQLTLRV